MIIKAKSFGNFTVVSNLVARDKTISMQAKGLFLTLASLPTDWVIYQTQLHEFSTNGRDAVMKAFKELIAANYILAVQKVNKSGQFKGWNYIVYPEKQLGIENPITENPLSENPFTDNQALINKEETNKENTKQILKHTQSFSSFSENSEQQAHKQSKGKQPKRENGKQKATDTIDVRRKRLWTEICIASKTVSTNQESADAFHEHYVSTAIDNPNLMRFETDRFWNTEKRLAKWMKLERPNEYD